MRLAATKVGVGVPARDFSGVVRQTFRNACVLAVNGSLITLVPTAAGVLPGAITIAVEIEPAFDEEIAVGAQAAARGGVLRFAGARHSVDLRSATPWSSHLDALDLDLSSGSARPAWTVAMTMLDTDGRHSALRGLARKHLDDLISAVGKLDLRRASAAATRLIGLGAGGTPAGDDFLVGCLAALWSSRQARDSRFASRLGEAIAKGSTRTNRVSRVYLEAAAIGEVSERLTDVVRAIALGLPRQTVAQVAGDAIAVGHTSGADGVFGFLATAAALPKATSALTTDAATLPA